MGAGHCGLCFVFIGSDPDEVSEKDYSGFFTKVNPAEEHSSRRTEDKRD